MLGVLFACIALVTGWATCRLLGVELALAPAAGLGVLAIVTTWAIALGLPLTPVLATLIPLGCAFALRRTRHWPRGPFEVWTAGLLVVAAVIPAAMLGVAFAGLGTPVSNHDGAFHVETVDALRLGMHPDTWYPLGYHTTVAGMLGFAPWVDTARGTSEASEGLSALAPLAIFGLARALGAVPRVAAVAAVIQALTFIFPYEFHLWGGWPLGMSVVLTLGLWTAALRWVAHPGVRLAALVGILTAAILLTHGTEIITAGLGLLVFGAARARHMRWGRLAVHVPLVACLAAVLALPYLPALLGWAGGGGATGSAPGGLPPGPTTDMPDGGLVAQVLLGSVGANSLFDLPVRVGLIALGLFQARTRLAACLWLVFVLLVTAFAFANNPLLGWVFTVTYPWAADQRLLQITAATASSVAAAGLAAAVGWGMRLKGHLALTRPHTAWRVALLAAVLMGFLAESGGVSIYRRLSLASDSTFTRDDSRAMAWLRQNARPGNTLANDSSVDAGIWAPYKAGLPILQPRSGAGGDTERRQLVVDNIANLDTVPLAEAEACRLDLRYVYYGARLYGYQTHAFPSPAVLARATGLEEVFRSGDAIVFQTRLVCP